MRMPWYEDKGEQGEYKHHEACDLVTLTRGLMDARQSDHDVDVLYSTEGKVQSRMHNSSETGAVRSSEF